jgi:hypothetical protein
VTLSPLSMAQSLVVAVRAAPKLALSLSGRDALIPHTRAASKLGFLKNRIT